MKPILSSDIIDYLTTTLNDYMSPESVAGRIVDFIKALYGLYLLQNGEDSKFEEFFQMILEGASKNTCHIFVCCPNRSRSSFISFQISYVPIHLPYFKSHFTL